MAISEEIIIRCIQNTASEEEVRLLNKWLQEDKKNVELYYQMEEVWNSRNRPDNIAINKGWDTLFEDIKRTPQKATIPLQTSKPNSFSWVRFVAAACIGAIISSAVWFVLQSGKITEQELWVQNTVYNHTGVQSLLLSDSSEIYIHEHSKIIYPEVFKGNQRHIYLEGSAYFDIRKNTGKPFIVSIGNVEVEVTGTEFFIDSRSADILSVALISGGVDVSCINESGRKSFVKLTSGQEAYIDIIKGNIEVTDTDIDYYVIWKDGVYRFTDEPLEDIFRLIGKRLDLDIRISPSLKAKRFTGRFNSGDNIQEILATISKSYPVNFRITGKTVEISE